MFCAPVFFKSVEVGASLFKIDTDGAVASAPAAAPKSAPAPTPTPTPAASQHGTFSPFFFFFQL
jgi:pyruvate/2-oxoglutarate dehydrogenase complex dihydrolipoamide acyltransferase (E2) component